MGQVKIAILGCEYTIETKEDEQRATEVANLLEKWCVEARKQRPGAPSLTVLTLVALHLAHKYLKLKEEHETLLKQIEKRVEALDQAMIMLKT
jgi:cell division protein ZapA (FtsZ GTPase activity inhibitor)